MTDTTITPAEERAHAEGTRLMYRDEVCERVGKSYPTIWNWMREGRFPRSINLHEDLPPHRNRVAWYAHEVEAWLNSRPRTVLKGDPEPETSEVA